MCEIINKCEDALFGQLLQDMFENDARDTQLRRVYDKTAKFLTSSLVRYFYLPHDGTYGFKGVSEDLTGDAG
jgi:hypothetical protein